MMEHQNTTISPRILLIESGQNSSDELCKNLKDDGLTVIAVVPFNEESFLKQIVEYKPDAVLMNLSSNDHKHILSILQSKNLTAPVIYLIYDDTCHFLHQIANKAGHSYILYPFSIKDISARIQNATYYFDIEHKLNISFDVMENLFHIVTDAGVVIDTKGKVKLINEEFKRLTGFTKENTSDRHYSEVVRIESTKSALQPTDLIGECINRIASFTFPQESVMYNSQGRPISIQGKVTPILSRNDDENEKQLSCVLLLLRDISEQKKTDFALQESELKLQALLSTAPIAMMLLDMDCTIRYLEGRALRPLGIDKQGAVGKKYYEIFQGHDLMNDSVRRALQGEKFNLLIEVSSIQFDSYFSPFYDTSGKQQGILGVAINITRQKAVERRLKETQTELNIILENAPLGICVIGHDRTFMQVNNRLEEMFGYTRSELIGRNTRLIYSSDEEFERVGREVYSKLEQGEIYQTEVEFVRKGGTLFWASLFGKRLNPHNITQGISWIFEDIDSRKKSRLELEASEERFRAMANFTYDWEYWQSPNMSMIYVSPSCERISGYRAEEYYENPDLINQIIHPLDRPMVLAMGHEGRVKNELFMIDFRIITLQGDVRWISHVSQPIVNAHGEYLGRRVSNRDTTARKGVEEQLFLSSKVFENALEGIMITDERTRILKVNPAFGSISGYEAEEVIGQTPDMLSSGKMEDSFYDAMWQTLNEKGYWQGEIWNRKKNREIYPEWLKIHVVRDEKSRITNYIGVFTDISSLKQNESRLVFLSNHDPLTKLPSRNIFEDRLSHAITQAVHNNGQIAVFFLDLDRFKSINDLLNHSIGDQLLQAVAQRFRESIREEDTVARMGGDEFSILIEEMNSSQDAVTVAHKIIHSLTFPFHIEDHEIFTTASIGIALFPEDGSDSNTLLRNADMAMHKAKSKGKNNYQFYATDMNTRVYERLALENSLRYAIKHDEFLLFYQPKIDLKSGQIRGLETLIRWLHPDIGLVPPGDFIPIAEEIGMIIEIGEWVLQTTCNQIKTWRNQGIDVPRIAINFSSPHFQKRDLVPWIENLIETHGIRACDLEFEITESIMMSNVEYTNTVLNEISNRGIHITIDDFGTGYSSLAYLKKFPLDSLKIDRSFISEMSEISEDLVIVKAIIAMAHSLKLKVVAEGVETQQQLNYLKQCECDEVQGNFFSKPVAVGQITEILRTKSFL